ncbi:uncharacterized protein DSM5745_09755 [Aspergillus mulundensis]|uniref:Uncharacterized protein n=1 Tax=Aspergillus mulundensis TaxID=1810919 RepID=A0A3D8QS82_9EURO|nr:Uncharacterized protein DSM5745_09755 [Aspergillus mulundensis]RDW64344.1 Uncharacterized protein DSM5745_09755 [Aspergillus mulundensis]
MPHSVRHWPGGIPSCIKRHPVEDLSIEELKEEVKGWLLFVKETWVARPDSMEDDDEYELDQRRALVEQWASASQGFRDSFHARANFEDLRYPAEAMERIEETIQQYNPQGLICLVPIDKGRPVDYARFIKFAILLYRYDPETGHCLGDSYMPEAAVLNPVSDMTNRFEDFLRWSDLETADFRSIYLTRSGSVVYNGFLGPYLLLDEEGLRTGRLSLVQFKQNGAVEDLVEIRPFNMFWPYLDLTVHIKGLEEIRHCDGGRRHQNTPINMDLPILDIVCHASEANQLPSDISLSTREQWAEDIELYAPGYLALEEAGRGAEYDFSRFSVPRDIAGVQKRVWEKLKAGDVPRFQYLPNVPPEQRPPQLQLQTQAQTGPRPMDFQGMLAALARQHADRQSE